MAATGNYVKSQDMFPYGQYLHRPTIACMFFTYSTTTYCFAIRTLVSSIIYIIFLPQMDLAIFSLNDKMNKLEEDEDMKYARRFFAVELFILFRLPLIFRPLPSHLVM